MWFGVLGPLRIEVGGKQELVPVSAARLRAVLAILLWRAGRPVSVDELCEMVWHGAPPKDGPAALRALIVRLRRTLGPQAGARILTRAPGYLIEVAQEELDAARFGALCRDAGSAIRAGDWRLASRAAADAVALWRSEPLVDVACDALREAWVPHLEQIWVQALEWRIEADLHLGRHERVIPELCDLTGQHPLRERFHAQLTLALYRAGRQAEALAAYQHARHALIEQLGIEPGPELRDLHQRILAGNTDLLTPPLSEDSRRVEGLSGSDDASVVPRQLPAAPQHFTGRRTELDTLTGLLRDTHSAWGTVVISAIDGMAGIGKTAIAVHAAHRLAQHFPDGQLFVDLHGYTQGYAPRSAGEALEMLLRALGVPAQQIPTETELRAGVYRQRLADTRTLIVLDNAADEAQVRPLVPGHAGCLVLVTSRRRLKGLDDARSLSLDLLPPPEAVALLHAVAGPDRVPADDPLLDEVARLCGRLPLALRIAAALLRHRPAWTLDHLAGLLHEQCRRVRALSDGERDLATVFDLSYRSLNEPHRNLFRRLGLVPGSDLDAYAAAALIECDPYTATEMLEELVDHNLLICHAPGRYRLHDLMRAHARTLAAGDPEPDCDSALDRLLHYYAHTAQNASLPIALYPRPIPGDPAPAHTPTLPDSKTAHAWLRTERDNIEAAHTHARIVALDEHAVALAAGLAEILRGDGPYTRALELHQAAVETAERRKLSAALANALLDLGMVQRLSGDSSEAGGTLTRALEIFRAIGHRHGEAYALNELGVVRRLTGDLASAGAIYARSLEIFRTIGHRHGEAYALTHLGIVRQLTGDLAGAGDAHTQALEIFNAINHCGDGAYALANLGAVQRLTGDLARAGDTYARSLEIFRAIGHRHGEAYALNHLGILRQLTGNLPAAEDALSQALEIYHASGHRQGEAYALTELGRVRRLTGDLVGAGAALTRALEIFGTTGYRSDEAWALNYYAATIAASGDLQSARALYQRALAMNREMNKPDDQAAALEGLGECCLAEGDTEAAIIDLHQALDIFRRIGMALDTRRIQHRLDTLAALRR